MNTEVATKRGNTLADLLERGKAQIQRALPGHMTAERMVRVALTVVNNTPALKACSIPSLASCVMQASQLGLEPDNVLGQAYLVPYKKHGKPEAKFIIGYKGLIALARRSGDIASIHAVAVYKDDEFHYERGLEEKLQHVPSRNPDNHSPADLVAAYAVARTKDGSVQWDVMERWEIDLIRSRSQAGRSGPWVSDYPEMAKKTVLRRLCKVLPLSAEVQRGVQAEELRERGISVADEESFVDADMTVVAESEPPQSKLSAFARERMQEEPQPDAPPETPEEPVRKPRKTRSDKGQPRKPKGQGSLMPDPVVPPEEPLPPAEPEESSPYPSREELLECLPSLNHREDYVDVLVRWQVDPDDLGSAETTALAFAWNTLCERAEAAKT